VGSIVDAYGAIWNHGTPEKNGQNLMVFTISRVSSERDLSRFHYH
jgi:hypothetical protein